MALESKGDLFRRRERRSRGAAAALLAEPSLGTRAVRGLGALGSLLLLGGCMVSSPVDRRLDELVATMADGVATAEPSAHFTRRMDEETVFYGSYDWHSCVIAHWALLTHARVAGEAAAAGAGEGPVAAAAVEGLLEALTLDALAREVDLLAGRDRRLTGTAPYDEAWLCMLLAERSRHSRSAAEAEELLAVRVRQERRVVDLLERTPFPEGIPPVERGGSGFCGFYRSWLWAWLLLHWSEPVDPRTRVLLDRWRSERIEPQRDAIEALEGSHGYDFLSVPAVLALVDRATLEDPGPWTPPPFAPWPESVELRMVHVLGLELCRVWPSAADAGRGVSRAQQAWTTRTETLLARDDLWRGDFAVVSHWVPQFLFIGWWLQHGRP